ncbi:unnamed protein product, partial [Polarella glacialis]
RVAEFERTKECICSCSRCSAQLDDARCFPCGASSTAATTKTTPTTTATAKATAKTTPTATATAKATTTAATTTTKTSTTTANVFCGGVLRMDRGGRFLSCDSCGGRPDQSMAQVMLEAESGLALALDELEAALDEDCEAEVGSLAALQPVHPCHHLTYRLARLRADLAAATGDRQAEVAALLPACRALEGSRTRGLDYKTLADALSAAGDVDAAHLWCRKALATLRISHQEDHPYVKAPRWCVLLSLMSLRELSVRSGLERLHDTIPSLTSFAFEQGKIYFRKLSVMPETQQLLSHLAQVQSSFGNGGGWGS